jgi:hypothetical protein
MILKLYKDIAEVVKNINDNSIKVYTYNQNESRFWENVRNAAGDPTGQYQFTGYTKPEQFPAFAFYVSQSTYSPKTDIVEYVLELVYFELSNYEKKNPHVIYQDAENVLWLFNSLLTRQNCGYKLKGDFKMVFFEDKNYMLTTGAYAYAAYERKAEFDPCCLDNVSS